MFGDDGAALHVGSIVVEPGVDGHLAVFGRVPVQPVDTEDDFVVVAHAQGFGDAALHGLPLRAVEVHQPVSLVGKDGREREDDHEGDVFRGEFHACKITAFCPIFIRLIRLNNTSGKTW